MKATCSILAISALLASPAMARRGQDSSSDVVARGSQAWFAYETAEHQIRALLAASATTADAVTGFSVDLTSTSTADVLVETTGGQFTDACRMVDHWSRNNTVLKKEVNCDGTVGQPRTDLVRGSQAWALVEGAERSLRLAIAADASVLESVSFADSDWTGQQVNVTIGLTSGAELQFVCTLGSSLNCAAR